MTREEAIHHIRDVIAENNSIAPNMVTFNLEKQALYMAIEALKEPEIIKCKDCIYFEVVNKEGWCWCNETHESTRPDRFCWRARKEEK